jgi:hypothetical protein
VDLAAPLLEGASRVCVSCHAAESGFDLPTASALALVTGTLGFAADGTRLRAPAPHAALERGCLACHGTADVPGVERGSSHRFSVAGGACGPCHQREPGPPAELDRRIRELAARFPGGALDRASARPGQGPRTREDQARWNAALAVNDRGLWAHGGPGALALVEAAEALLAPRE